MGFGKDGKGVIIVEQRSQVVGTLNGNASLIIGVNLATVERFRMLKNELRAVFVSSTAGDMVGMGIGIADGDLTTAQIEEAIETNGPLGPNDIVNAEEAMRPVWMLGTFDGRSDVAVAEKVMLDDLTGGAVMTKSVRWTFAAVKSWNYFLYNGGTAPTTGASILIRAKSFGVWVT